MRPKFHFFLYLSLLLGCNSNRSAEVTVRNDIQDKEYNRIEISQIRHSGGVALSKYSLNPGNEVSLPFRGVTHLRVSRQYANFTSIYEVNCPAIKKKVLLKLIDIYLNKMPGGCVLTKVGEEKGGITTWK